jgi:hypothetical protein
VFAAACRAVLDAFVPGDADGLTFAQKIAQTLAKRALRGDVDAARALADRAEGKPIQAIDLQNNEDRLQQLLDAFAEARLNPPPRPPDSSESVH